MYQFVITPVAIGAGRFLQSMTFDSLTKNKPDAFERLPINLSADEIRVMVRDILG